MKLTGRTMIIEICETAGLCFGANRALNFVEEKLKENNNVCVYKQILHNENLIKNLQNKGVNFCEDINEIPPNSFVVLRAHGERKEIYGYLDNQNIQYVDAICPNVKNVKDCAIKMEQQGFKIIVLGTKKNEKLHDETNALISFLDNPIIMSSADNIDKISFDEEKYFLVCQTTFNLTEFNKIVDILKIKLGQLNKTFEFSDTVCRFPILNIKRSIDLANQCDCLIVYGSQNSANTTELYNAVKNIKPTFFSIEKEEILNQLHNFISQSTKDSIQIKVAILAGASTLKSDLEELKQYLESNCK